MKALCRPVSVNYLPDHNSGSFVCLCNKSLLRFCHVPQVLGMQLGTNPTNIPVLMGLEFQCRDIQ